MASFSVQLFLVLSKMLIVVLSSDNLLQETEFSFDFKPQQIHLSYTGSPRSMFVTFATLSDSEGQGSAAFWKISNTGSSQSTSVPAAKTKVAHTLDGTTRYTYIYRATMEQLEPDTIYEFFVTSSAGMKSSVFRFKTFPIYNGNDDDNSAEFKPKFAIFGDLGVQNDFSLPQLTQDATDGEFDMVLHLGGFAYDMYEQNGEQGDTFMNMIQPISTKVPYNVAVGNHEEYDNFTEYVNRFTSPPPSVFYHSFNLGPIHFVMFSSEFYFYDNYGIGQLQAQYNWLVEDLAKANTPEARNAQPWIVVMAHRPMYCSSDNDHDCTKQNSIMRTGYNNVNFSLEHLFFQNGVDLQFYAHEHNYERLYPMCDYNYQPVNNLSFYHNVHFPVHVTSGSAGCREIHDRFSYPKPRWSAVRANDYGFTLLSVEQKMSLRVKQFSVDKGKFIDDFTLSKRSVYPNFDPLDC